MDPNIPTQPVQKETQVTQSNLQQTVNKSPSPRGKWELISLIVTLLIIVGSGTYYLGIRQNKLLSQNQQKQVIPTIVQSIPTPTLAPTASWNTYTSFVGGFEIKYPLNWKIVNGITDNTTLVAIDIDNPKNQNDGLPEISITVDKLGTSTGYTENSTISGVKAYRTSAPSGMQAATEGIEFKNIYGLRYNIYLLYDDGKSGKQPYDPGIYNKEAVSIYNILLSTFKFTPGQVIVPTISKNLLDAITVVPQQANLFTKYRISEDICASPIGLVAYYDKDSDSWMKINSLVLPGNAGSKNDLLTIDGFLNGGTLASYQDVGSFVFPFRQDCGGYYAYYIKELPNILYPNTDKSRTIMMYTGQQAFGGVRVIILAKKGDDIIYLEKVLDSSILTADRNSCGFQSYMKNGSGGDDNCYRKTLVSDKSLEATSIEKAKSLVTLFSIKN
jgi:hypothetical protein